MKVSYIQKLLLLNCVERKSDITRQIIETIKSDPTSRRNLDKYEDELKDLEYLKTEVKNIEETK